MPESHSQEMSRSITENMVRVLPIIKRKFLQADTIHQQHGIPNSHINVLTLLYCSGSMPVSEISRQLSIAKPNITPILDKLYDKGMIDRTHDDKDRRVVRVVLLPKGEETVESILRSIAAQFEVYGQKLTEKDLNELDQALESVARILTALS